MTATLVSVIIPAFNAAAYLREAIDSVVAQADSQTALEIIVVDDGSTDDTADIVRSCGEPIRYLRLPHCGRPGAVRNCGLKAMRGDFVGFLDADDVWLPGGLGRRLRILQEQPSVGFVYANYFVQEGEKRALSFVNQDEPSGWIFDELLKRNFVHTNTVLARRSLIEASGGFASHLHNAEDYWLWLQLAKRGRAAFVPDPVAVYRQRAGSISRTALTKKLPDLIRAVQSVGKQFGVPSFLLRQRINPLRAWLAKEHFTQARYGQMARWVLPVLLTEPLQVFSALRFLRTKVTRQEVA